MNQEEMEILDNDPEFILRMGQQREEISEALDNLSEDELNQIFKIG
jgi:hypothetical protein